MKKLAIVILLFSLSLNTYPQFSKGKILIGGDLRFYNSSMNMDDKSLSSTYSSNSNSTNFSIIPNIGYFLSEKFALGLVIGYNYYSNSWESNSTSLTYEYNYESKRTKSDFLIGPFVRYYKHISDKIKIFGHTSFEFGYGEIIDKTTNTDTTITRKGNSISYDFDIRPGIAFLVTEKFSIEATFGNLSYIYQIEETGDDPDKRKQTNNGLNFSFNSIGLGIQFYL